MRHPILATIAIFASILFVAWLVQAKPLKLQGKPADTEDDRSPPPPHREDCASEDGAREADKFVTIAGVVASFNKNPKGDVDGLRLEDGSEVRFPAKSGEKLTGIVSVKDKITIEGWTHSGEKEICAAKITNDASGKAVDVDRAPPKSPRDESRPPEPKDREENVESDRRPPRPEEGGSHRPPRPDARNDRPAKGDSKRQYSIEQATSDKAQLHTIAFDGLAFLTGDFGYDTFLPPGKVSDYFGFQYMRDIDAREGGHNTSFLTRIANNVLTVLNDSQKAQFLALAKEQESDVRRFAEMRFPLIKAFRQNLEGNLPAGKQLDKKAVVAASAKLYELDGSLAYGRAKVMGEIIHGLSDGQRAALAKLKFGDSGTWPEVPEPLDRRSMSHEANVAMMTYASEMFAWYAGSLDADAYFCPERHGMYFGGFGMKTAPAMGKKNYSISTSLTGDSGEAFLTLLDDAQRKNVTDLPDLQRRDLAEIVKIRREIAAELRRFQKGETADKDKVLSLSKRYGELDGEMSYLYATAFAKVGKSLSAEQKAKLTQLRKVDPSEPKGPFLYSNPIKSPKIEDTERFFGTD